ncbi:MAG: roadblock/LC7 domain-containing protein [Betaproteobacteria bacterium]
MSTTHSPLVAKARRAAAMLVAAIGGDCAVVISTADGFDLAHAGDRAAEPARFAAMMSSFAAVGAAASQEAGIGLPRCMVVESTQGRLVVRCLQFGGEPIVIMLLTDKSVLLGLALNQLSAVERSLNGA